MNARVITWASALLNLALATGILITRHQPAVTRDLVAPAAAPALQPVTTSIEPPPATSEPAMSPARFHWSQISHTDLKVYRDNLRAINCPKATVRDIILGEVNEQFELRRQNVLASVQARFWDVAIRGEQAIRTEWGQPIAELNAERQQMINSLFGHDVDTVDETESQASADLRERHLLWLSAEKRAALLTLDERRRLQLDEWSKSIGSRPGGEATPEDNARLQQLEKEYANARNELLTPEEQAELRLRNSKESLWASGLSGFQPTETEWRSVAQLRVEHDEAQLRLAASGADVEQRRQLEADLQAELERSTQAALGPERFREYEMATDESYQDVQKVTRRHGLSDSVASQAYQLRQNAQSRAQQLRDDSTLSAETRQAALTALQLETERALTTALGGKVFSTYKRYAGGWLGELNPAGSE